MATSNKRLIHRSPASGSYAAFKGKMRMSTGSFGLNPIKEHESSFTSSHDLNRSGQTRLMRQLSNEFISSSPYAAPVSVALPRSKSVTKIKSKSFGGKQTTPERVVRIAGHHRGESLASKSHFPVTPHILKAKRRSDLSAPLNQTLSIKDALRGHLSSQLNLSFNNSFNTSISAMPSVDSPHGCGKEVGFSNEMRGIKEELMRKLGEVEASGGVVWREEILACGKAMEALSALDKSLATVLEILKAKYEIINHSLSEQLTRETLKFQSELSQLQASLLKEIDEKKAFKRKFEKISRENVELSRSCETYQSKCFDYQEKLFDIANVKLDTYPPTEQSWRLVISELETYKVWKESALKELKGAQIKERKLLELLHAIKNRGFPIEEVYNSDVRKRPATQTQTPSERESEDFESEPIASGPPLARIRPELVPVLKMEAVEREITSESESSSHPSTLHDSQDGFIPYKTLSNSSTHSNLTSSEKVRPQAQIAPPGVEKKPVPQLPIPMKDSSADGFHQEFMEKYEEFSESWRKQIDAQKH